MTRVVRVLPDEAAIDKEFEYAVPDRWAAAVEVGAVVRVPLHGRRVGGWITAVGVPTSGRALQPVARVSGVGPPAPLFGLAEWAAWRWAGRRATFLQTASPPGVVAGLPPAPGTRPVLAPTAVDASAADAFGQPRSVVRAAPAADTFPYVEAAARRLRQGVLVLCPSVSAATHVARRLSRTGTPTALMPRDWAMARAGGCVVVGARAAAWAPLGGLDAVVVLDAHDERFAEERAPTWNAWVVAAERARRDGAPCVLVSPCPSVEQLAWGQLIEPTRAAEREGWAALDVVDRREDDPRAGLLGSRLVQLVRGSGRVVCVFNRTGRARLLACGACGALAACERCAASVEQREVDLACRRCGTVRPVVCAACASQRLKVVRPGVSRVREELEAMVGEPVAEVTAATDALPSTRVLIGTEAVLHRVGQADVVAFLDIDQELFAPRFRAAEQSLALLALASRVVGGRRGRVLVQTRAPKHEVVQAALLADPARAAEAERVRRAELRLPPMWAVALVSGAAAEAFVTQLASLAVEVEGPSDGQWIVRAPDHRALCDAFASARRGPGRLRIEIDPVRS